MLGLLPAIEGTAVSMPGTPIVVAPGGRRLRLRYHPGDATLGDLLHPHGGQKEEPLALGGTGGSSCLLVTSEPTEDTMSISRHGGELLDQTH